MRLHPIMSISLPLKSLVQRGDDQDFNLIHKKRNSFEMLISFFGVADPTSSHEASRPTKQRSPAVLELLSVKG